MHEALGTQTHKQMNHHDTTTSLLQHHGTTLSTVHHYDSTTSLIHYYDTTTSFAHHDDTTTSLAHSHDPTLSFVHHYDTTNSLIHYHDTTTSYAHRSTDACKTTVPYVCSTLPLRLLSSHYFVYHSIYNQDGLFGSTTSQLDSLSLFLPICVRQNVPGGPTAQPPFAARELILRLGPTTGSKLHTISGRWALYVQPFATNH